MKLHEQIIDALKNTSSESPLTSSDVLSKLDTPTLDAYQNALDQLYNERRVNRCMVFKNGIESCFYWLTASGLKTIPYGMFQINPNKSIQAPRRDEIKQPKVEEKVMKPDGTKSMAENIRSLIKEYPGITHHNLLSAVANYSQDEAIIKKAEDMIIYTVIKKDGFTRHNDIHLDGRKITKTYYSNDDYAKFKQKQIKAVKNDTPTIVQANAINLTASSEPIPEELKPYVKAAEQINVSSMPSALNSQVGGDHYKKLGIYQPWEVFKRWMTPEEFKGAMKKEVITYLAREQDKGGREDIEKAMHTMQIYLELTA